MSIWTYLAIEDTLPETKGLFEWSLNCQQDKPNVWHLFMALIGYTDTVHGYALPFTATDLALGYVELGYLGDALNEYADKPQDVYGWIRGLEEADL
jgi:hypothetical protein